MRITELTTEERDDLTFALEHAEDMLFDLPDDDSDEYDAAHKRMRRLRTLRELLEVTECAS